MLWAGTLAPGSLHRALRQQSDILAAGAARASDRQRPCTAKTTRRSRKLSGCTTFNRPWVQPDQSRFQPASGSVSTLDRRGHDAGIGTRM